MRYRIGSSLFVLAAVFLATPVRGGKESVQMTPPTQPTFATWAATPPMGWNSYDAFGDTVTEAEVLANASYMRDKLLAHGWQYVVIDFRWYDPEPIGNDVELTKRRTGAKLTADSVGRFQPAVNRFPSAADGQGFKALADRIHAMGLKFGVHIMRGIPCQAVNASTPIDGSTFTAADAGDPGNHCVWCPDMFGVRDNAAGQAWYDSVFRQYAAWGLDYVKVDDLSVPYSKHEIEMIRRAIDRCGRPIVLSTSPGPTNVEHADHLRANANLWRISGDFWDKWAKLNEMFDLLHSWSGAASIGHWPDADMIPFGRIAIRSRMGGTDHFTHFTKDEQTTLMTLWCLAPSPLMLGMHLPDNDDWTLSLLTNAEAIAVNQDKAGAPARRVARNGQQEVWAKPLADGSLAVGLFNRGESAAEVSLGWKAIGLDGPRHVRDLWRHRDEPDVVSDAILRTVPAHGAVLLRLSKPR